MAWLRKAQSIPVFPSSDPGIGGSRGPIRGQAFWDFIGQPEPMYPEPDFVNNADYGFTKNELVYACIMEKATSLPDAPFRVFGPDGQGEPREDHPLRKLLANPNPSTTEFELIELTSIYMDLAGIAFWEIVTDRLDRPVELWPLRPDLVRIWPQANGQTEYGYVLGQNRVVPLGTNVLAFKYPNPTNPPLGQAPMRSANRAVALDNEATDFVKSLLQNRAVPGTVIETEQKIDEGLTTRLTEKWVERFGGNNRGAPAFLQKGMKVQTLGLDLGQLEFPDLRTISESRICMSFGVPPILVGAKVGLDRSTFANYAEARRSLWEETLMPLQKRMQQVIVAKLMPMVEGPRPRRSVARFDNSEVLALREAEGRRWELATQALRAGGITRNQFRRYVGLPTTPDGDVFLLPAGVVPTDEEGNPLVEPPAPVAPVVPDQPDDQDEQGDEDQADQGKSLMAVKAEIAGPQPGTAESMLKAIRQVVRDQRTEFLIEVEKAHALLVISPDRKDIPWDGEKWDRRLARAVEPFMRQAAHIAARKVSTDASLTPMKAYIAAAAANVAKNWNERTRMDVDAATTVGGADVLDNVEKAFALAAGVRALQLATSLVSDMNGFGKVDEAKRAGLSTKTWQVNSRDPRPEHAAVDGETVPVSDPFSNGLMWPSGPNCQCDVIFEEGTER